MAKAIYTGSGSVAKKVKEIYIGVGGQSRRVTKAYIGINGVARQFLSKGTITRSVAASLSSGRKGLAGGSVGPYALFIGGMNGATATQTVDVYTSALAKGGSQLVEAMYDVSATTVNDTLIVAGMGFRTGTGGKYDMPRTEAFNSSLSRSILSTTMHYGAPASTTVGQYAIFAGGGTSRGSKGDIANAYTSNFALSTPGLLSIARDGIAATTIGNYAIFAGGSILGTDEDGSYDISVSSVDVYNSSLTKTTAASLSSDRAFSGAATIGPYAIIAGGMRILSTAGPLTAVDVYTDNLARGTSASLPVAAGIMASCSLGGYAFFAGGQSDNQKPTSAVNVYNANLIRTSVSGLQSNVQSLAAATVGDYALFGGGSYTNYPTGVTAYQVD